MAKRKPKDSDSPGLVTARGLSTLALAVGRRFTLAEGSDVEAAFIALTRAVELVDELEKRVQALERGEKAARPKLKVAS